jgi:hypothetical protein
MHIQKHNGRLRDHKAANRERSKCAGRFDREKIAANTSSSQSLSDNPCMREKDKGVTAHTQHSISSSAHGRKLGARSRAGSCMHETSAAAFSPTTTRTKASGHRRRYHAMDHPWRCSFFSVEPVAWSRRNSLLCYRLSGSTLIQTPGSDRWYRMLPKDRCQDNGCRCLWLQHRLLLLVPCMGALNFNFHSPCLWCLRVSKTKFQCFWKKQSEDFLAPDRVVSIGIIGRTCIIQPLYVSFDQQYILFPWPWAIGFFSSIIYAGQQLLIRPIVLAMDDNHAVTSNGRHVQPYLEVTRQNTSTRLSTMQNIGWKHVEKKKNRTGKRRAYECTWFAMGLTWKFYKLV